MGGGDARRQKENRLRQFKRFWAIARESKEAFGSDPNWGRLKERKINKVETTKTNWCNQSNNSSTRNSPGT